MSQQTNNNACILGANPSIEQSWLKSTKDLFSEVGHNTGNLAFLYAIKSHTQITHFFRQQTNPDTINNNFQRAILPCANQVGSHTDMKNSALILNKLKVNITAIGLGAQSSLDFKKTTIPPGTVAWIKEIEAHSHHGVKNISVRGEFTADLLRDHGLGDKIEVLGCPSLFINPSPDLGGLIMKRWRYPKKIAIAAGHQKWQNLRHIENSLANLVTATNGSYITQSGIEMLGLARGKAAELEGSTLKECLSYIQPQLDSHEFINWCNTYATSFFNIESWLEHYLRYDLVIGIRIHGVALALQAGIPGLCIAHDSRIAELCQTMKIPYVTTREIPGGLSRDLAVKFFEERFDPIAFNENRKSLFMKYQQFLTNNHISISQKYDQLGLPPIDRPQPSISI